MIHLFIDTNIYLNFFSYSEDDLDKLSALHKLISETNQINLIIPSQVVDEFKRNRESRIKEALKKFEENNTNVKLPRLCSEFEEANEMLGLSRKLSDAKSRLSEKLEAAISAHALKADLIIDELFFSKQSVPDQIIGRAEKRIKLGNPPGKNNSLGDAINWEFLLDSVTEGLDLYFVSDDIDYRSTLNDNLFSPVLQDEWESKKKSGLFYYKTLNGFFTDKFPEIKLSDDYIIDIKIKELGQASSFNDARSILRRLHQINEFSDSQVNEVINAAISNDQVYNAHIYSSFVGEYLKEIISGHEDQIPEDTLKEFYRKFREEKEDEEVKELSSW